MRVPLSDNALLLLEDVEALKKIMTAMSCRHINQIDDPLLISVQTGKQKPIILKVKIRKQ